MTKELAVSDVVEKITDFIGTQKDQFVALNEHCVNKLDFLKESQFALQLLTKNDYLLGVGRNNPDSLQAAISNVAAIGITLNPALSFAYLVPRKINKVPCVCLDISYRGLIKLATDTGVVKAMKAELVYESDDFKYHGFHEAPDFNANPFDDRGDLKGVYAMAMLTDGGVLVETMSIDEVNMIRDDSEAYKSAVGKGMDSWNYTNNVWVKYYTEMVKKTVIKRAYKTLPTSKGMETVGKAIEVINEHEGIDFQADKQLTETFYTDEELTEYQRCVDNGDFYNLLPLINSLCAESQLDLKKLCVPEAEAGKKTQAKEEWQKNLKEAENSIEASLDLIKEYLDGGEDAGVHELMDAALCSDWTINYFLSQLSPEQQIAANKLLEAA